MDTNITFRFITPRDEEFLYRVYAGTREEELAPTPWTVSEKEAFLRMQFAFQHKYYTEVFSTASFTIIELSENPIGRLYIDCRENEVHIIDIALLSEYRCRGIGTCLLNSITAEADARNLPTSIYVERFNRAQNLCRRLGFTKAGDSGIYMLMQWKRSEQ